MLPARVVIGLIRLPAVVGLGLTIVLGMSKAEASTFCPPKGPGAPTYCNNIPYKNNEGPSNRLPSSQRTRLDDAQKGKR
jgi:hypothetical protein